MEITSRRIITMVMSGMTSAAFSALLALPDRPAGAGPADVAPESDRPTAATRPARTCYGGAQRVRLEIEVTDSDYGVGYDSPRLVVTPGSPCRDINVRDPRNLTGPATGQQACTLVKVLLDGRDIVGWVDTCAGWQVLARLVPEGKPFVLRAALRPVDVTVAS